MELECNQDTCIVHGLLELQVFIKYLPIYDLWISYILTWIIGAIVRPKGNNFVSGISSYFNTQGLVIDDAIVVPKVALHVNFGYMSKDGSSRGSISGQVASLRKQFKKAAVSNATKG
jgi:hypothetical protein